MLEQSIFFHKNNWNGNIFRSSPMCSLPQSLGLKNFNAGLKYSFKGPSLHPCGATRPTQGVNLSQPVVDSLTGNLGLEVGKKRHKEWMGGNQGRE